MTMLYTDWKRKASERETHRHEHELSITAQRVADEASLRHLGQTPEWMLFRSKIEEYRSILLSLLDAADLTVRRSHSDTEIQESLSKARMYDAMLTAIDHVLSCVPRDEETPSEASSGRPS